jgi:hypothetical protein
MTQDEAGQTAASFQEEIDVFEIYKRLNNANRHKMDTIPFVLCQNDKKSHFILTINYRIYLLILQFQLQLILKFKIMIKVCIADNYPVVHFGQNLTLKIMLKYQ